MKHPPLSLKESVEATATNEEKKKTATVTKTPPTAPTLKTPTKTFKTTTRKTTAVQDHEDDQDENQSPRDQEQPASTTHDQHDGTPKTLKTPKTPSARKRRPTAATEQANFSNSKTVQKKKKSTTHHSQTIADTMEMYQDTAPTMGFFDVYNDESNKENIGYVVRRPSRHAQTTVAEKGKKKTTTGRLIKRKPLQDITHLYVNQDTAGWRDSTAPSMRFF